jgi:hypothetical protein
MKIWGVGVAIALTVVSLGGCSNRSSATRSAVGRHRRVPLTSTRRSAGPTTRSHAAPTTRTNRRLHLPATTGWSSSPCACATTPRSRWPSCSLAADPTRAMAHAGQAGDRAVMSLAARATAQLSRVRTRFASPSLSLAQQAGAVLLSREVAARPLSLRHCRAVGARRPWHMSRPRVRRSRSSRDIDGRWRAHPAARGSALSAMRAR